MWVSNTGHGPGLRRRLGRLRTTQGTQVWGQMGTELLQSVWPTVYTRFYQGREGFCFGLVWFFQESPKGNFQAGVGPVWAHRIPTVCIPQERRVGFLRVT